MFRPRRVGLLSLLVVVALTVVAGCSSSGPGPSGPSADAASRLVSPGDFGVEVDAGERFVLNVHTPDEGSIEGTDASIPFDQLDARAAELPADRDTPLGVYCKTGRMSEVAVAALVAMGFGDVIELRGGMEAWMKSGRTLLEPASAVGERSSSGVG